MEAFLASDDEDAREAKRAAERRKRRQAIERKHAAAQAAPQPIVEDPSKAQEEQSARDKAVKYEVTPLGLTEVKPDDDAFDMFTGEGDIDAPAPVKVGKRATAAQLLAGELGEEEQANWDDTDGYYMARPGETIDGRYRVLGVVGRGVFSSVLKARDEIQEKEKNEPCYVAVKMIRNNETMTKAAAKEIELLREISAGDPNGRCHCVRLLNETEHRAHTALIFESMAMNLREALKKYGKHVGINIDAVRIYAKQLLFALRHLYKLRIVHADIKPDNLCVSYGDLTRVGAGPSVDAIAAAGYNVTLIDYSISVDLRSFDKDQRFLASEGSPCQVKEYSWPPALKGASWRREVDLYGLGCILYQMVVSAIQPKGIDMTVTTLEKRIPRGWNKLLWAHILDQLLNARESADLGEMARDLRRNLEDDVLQGDTLRLVELLDHHRRLTPRDERGVANGGGAPSPPKPRVSKPRAPREKREPFFRPPLPMREKLIKWKLSGCTVAVTPITVIDTRCLLYTSPSPRD